MDAVCFQCKMQTARCDLPRAIPGPLAAFPPESISQYQSLPGRLAVITCYFNPCGYQSLKRNYLRFAAGMRERQIPLYTIELAFGDQPFFLKPAERVIQVRSGDVLWQKERMLNRLLETVPDGFDKIAWVDADLIFTNPRWADDASRLLEEYPVVQLFEQAVQLTKDDQPGEVRNGVAFAVAHGLKDAQHLGISHPGFAWAARRDLLARHGLLDDNIIGGGDSMMVYAMFGWLDNPYLGRYSDAMRRSFRAWAEPFWAEVRGRVGCVPGRVLHMWHGRRADRMYDERVTWLKQHDFDPRADLIPAGNGLWRWAPGKDALHELIRDYFPRRREDD